MQRYCEGGIGAALHSFVRPARSILPFTKKNATALGVRSTHPEGTPSVRRQKRELLPKLTSLAACAFPGTPLHAEYDLSTGTLRQPFRRRIVPGTTRSTRTGPHCLAGTPPGLPADFYSGHTPPLRCLKHPAYRA